jgi:hypothetical protein
VSLVVALTWPSTTAGQAGEPRFLGLAMSDDGLEIAIHYAAINESGAANVEQEAINPDGGSVARPRSVMSR